MKKWPAVIDVGKNNIALNCFETSFLNPTQDWLRFNCGRSIPEMRFKNKTIPEPPIMKLDSNNWNQIEATGTKLNTTGDTKLLNSTSPSLK